MSSVCAVVSTFCFSFICLTPLTSLPLLFSSFPLHVFFEVTKRDNCQVLDSCRTQSEISRRYLGGRGGVVATDRPIKLTLQRLTSWIVTASNNLFQIHSSQGQEVSFDWIAMCTLDHGCGDGGRGKE
ncbi:hypothetical protein Bpfe_001981 [Biomphalaria pfeifferi]|uniref:Uncharacterized protein n=1 Tax=Biomphalaria pfeifferi TaxID=112525 RepID=A0AAD8FLN9_BIOPF|nr:hypothetical protein Bpfe_001981 [Biomphalaria pfeifferi]